MAVRLQSHAFEAGAELTAFSKDVIGSGAVVSFSGLVRDTSGELSRLEIEHYAAMTERAIKSMETEAVERWKLDGCLIIHRYGSLHIGETIMMVATAARHRAAAFEAAEFLMDYLKSRAPFWKKEVSKSGEEWVAAKEDDEAALKRW